MLRVLFVECQSNTAFLEVEPVLDEQRFSIGTQWDLFEQGQKINRSQFDCVALTLDGDAHFARKMDP